MKDIITAGFCETGLKREKNQDSYLIRTGCSETGITGLFLVADGIGGLEFGEEASRKVADSLDYWWHNTMPEKLKDAGRNGTSLMKDISQEFLFIVKTLHNEMKLRSERARIQSGTTLSLLFIANAEYCIVHIGDSRIYKSGFFSFKLLTTDHNLSTEKYITGKINKHQWMNYKDKNPLLQCIGAGDAVSPQVITGKTRKGDKFFLCSDGVYKFIDEKTLARLIKNTETEKIKETLEEIRRIVYGNGATDNLTGIMVCCI